MNKAIIISLMLFSFLFASIFDFPDLEKRFDEATEITFIIHDKDLDNPVWMESYRNLHEAKKIRLGSIVPLPSIEEGEYYLEVLVDGSPTGDRIPFTTVEELATIMSAGASGADIPSESGDVMDAMSFTLTLGGPDPTDVTHFKGQVGIGTATPTAQLHTTGSVRFEGAGTPGEGRVLASDADGNATWQVPSAMGDGDSKWGQIGDDIFNLNDGSVGVGTDSPDPSAIVDISSTEQGFLPPRMTTAQRDDIDTPANALIIFNLTNDCLQIYNNGIWNNIWCDSCEPTITAHPSDLIACDDTEANFYITAGGSDLSYQWQRNDGTGWISISDGGIYSGATTSNLTVSPVSLAMDGILFRCIVSGSCPPDATSTNASLTILTRSIAASSAVADHDIICEGESNNLTVVGGSLGSGAEWYWYSGSCGGAFVDTGSEITVTPTSTGTRTYFVRAEGTCNTTSCVSVSFEVAEHRDIGVQYFTTVGEHTFTVPDGVTSISVAAVGGGGGGCGHLGGMGGDPDAVPGDPGGNSSFGAFITAYGGEGGGRQYDPAALGGGFDGPNGFHGGNGGTLYGGGGGGAATFTANGGDGGIGTSGTATYGGDGGDSGGSGRSADANYGRGGSGGGIYLTGTPNTGQDGQYGAGGNYGGGGGGSSVNAGGGGGGAGGGLVWQNYIAVTPGETYTVIVGEGGSSGASYSANGQQGAVRVIWEYTCSPEANYPNNAN